MRVAYPIAGLAAVMSSLLLAPELRADPVEDFYRGKTVRIVIGFGVGGGYDIYARHAAEFLGKHIPGRPTVIPQNMPGGGGLKAVEYLSGAAARDGSFLGCIAQTFAVDAVTDEKNKIDVTAFRYVGRLINNTDVGFSLPQSPIKTFEDVRQREVIAGASGPGSTSYIYPVALNAYAGAKFKIVRGYDGTADIQLALERGEVQVNPGYSLPGILAAHPNFITGKEANILYQNALKRSVLMPDIPTMPELGLTDEGRGILRVIASTTEVGRAIIAPPGIPADRLAALRTAFQAMVKDPEFLAMSAKRNVLIDAAPGEEIDALNAETMRLPKPTVDALRVLLKE